MENFTFEQLPQAMRLLHEKMSHLGRLLEERDPQQEQELIFNVSQAAAFLHRRQPTIQGDYVELWIPWSSETLRQDPPRKEVKKVRRFDGFCCVPSHLHYQKAVGNFYNLYHPLPWQPEEGPCKQTLF
ncbi:hypothetical protein GCM10023188_18620 [Pontibacter saemangeumensis]|uniref:Uncharacterized protein n=1 Tax=Pontibacter saemangeumensis TaxID=1084525 RepID=A0ABP8LLM4_9BACT